MLCLIRQNADCRDMGEGYSACPKCKSVIRQFPTTTTATATTGNTISTSSASETNQKPSYGKGKSYKQ